MEDDTTTTYPAPVDKLLTLGRPDVSEWLDYSALGLGPEHVPDLIPLATDVELNRDPDERAEVWGPVHAWRALGQLRAEAAVQPLLDFLAAEEEGQESEWLHEELPLVFGLIGPPAIPPLVAFLDNPARALYARAVAGSSLEQIGKQHPEAREECVAALVRQLEAGAANDPELNAFLITNLLHLKAVETLPVIRHAYEERWVDDFIVNLEDVEIGFGLKPERPLRFPSLRPHVSRAFLTGEMGRPHAEKVARKSKRKMAERSRRQNQQKKRKKK